MSCGNPHATPCSEVIEAVYLYLDGEMPVGAEIDIRLHLDECVPCLREYGLEREVKVLVARCCGNEPAPVGLRHRVLTRLREVRVEISTREYLPE